MVKAQCLRPAGLVWAEIDYAVSDASLPRYTSIKYVSKARYLTGITRLSSTSS
jgi:hypothetical protein